MQGQDFEATAEGGRASLDQRTELPQAEWVVSVWPDAGEASVTRRVPDEGDGSSWSALSDDERDRRNYERATARAKVESRRYLVANRLRYMWLLTFAVGLHG